MTSFHRICLVAAAVSVLSLMTGVVLGRAELWQPAAVIVMLGFTLGMGGVPAMRSYRYTAWILTAVVAAMIYPGAFLRWGDFDLRHKWLVLLVVQAVMFGMGTQMKLRDLAGVLRMPWGVFVAVGCQFLIMPLTGFALTKIFSFPPEIAAGVILIGCCSSGLASNVMTYLARGNLPLSITATACTTLLAPLMTPLWMQLLAGTLVEVKFFAMMMEIVKIVLVPIGAAMLHDYLKSATPAATRWLIRAQVVAGVGAVMLLITRNAEWRVALPAGGALVVEIAGFLMGAVAFGVTFHQLTKIFPRLEGAMPLFSMAGIVYFTTVTTAAGRDNLLVVGSLLIVVAILHNTAGYVLGYGLARLCRLDVQSARTVAIEVGLQNGGMASGLAGAMGKLATVGLAAAVFSPWMNISGSLLANIWRRRPVGEAPPRENPA